MNLKKFSLILISILIGSSARADDWDFTIKDYSKLKASGRDLEFSQQASWFPAPLRENLLLTLKHILDPNLRPSSADGVNLKDSFHGHVVCSGMRDPSEYSKRAEEMSESGFKARGFMRWHLLTKLNSRTKPDFVEALKESERNSGSFLDRFIRLGVCPDVSVIYHTYEYNTPSDMKLDDPRRHIRLKLGASEHIHYRPVTIDFMDLDAILKSIEEKNLQDTCVDTHIAHFGFLVDKRGRIYVSIGSGTEIKLRVENKNAAESAALSKN